MNARRWPAGLRFVMTELKLGSTFATAALKSSELERKFRQASNERLADANHTRVVRNAKNARLAYDVATQRVRLLLLPPDISEDLNRRFKRLHRQLEMLGEDF